MDRKTLNTLLMIASGALAIGGLILLLISIFSETKDNWTLSFALMAIILSNLFNLIRSQSNRKAEEKSNEEDSLEDHHE